MNAASRPTQMRNGRFKIIQPLSKGGMGALYLANETIATGARKVVIKEMLEYYDSKDPQGQSKAQRRFEAEAITLANLSIPGIPQVFDYFTEGGRHYIVMQFIEGVNLEQGLSRIDEQGNPRKGKPYSIDEVRRWGIDVAKLLESLAQQNVIHMDIKPANLILDKSGTVWLVDFGTSKAPRIAISGTAGAGPTGVQKSSIYGTLGYAAPEQAAGKPESRSDVYALASTLYHLATDDDPGMHPGKFPHLDRLPGDFTAALRRALSPDVRQRPAAREFGRALESRATRAIGFHWQDGSISQDPLDLVAAASQRWEEARTYFANQSLESWLQDMHRHDLAGRLAQIKSQVRDPDLGLDAFLRFLNPNLPPAVLQVPQTVLEVGELPWGTQRVIDLDVLNSGAGALLVRPQHLSPGIKAVPDALAVHRRQILKLVIDTNQLTPSLKPQLIPFTLDAGPAGAVRLRIRVLVPAPLLEIEPPELDLGSVARGMAVEAYFLVRNAGNSAFRCEVSSQIRNSGVNPAVFNCPPGMEQEVTLVVDTSQYSIGRVGSITQVQAKAGGWQDIRKIPTRIDISPFKTAFRTVGPLLPWIIIAGSLGAFLGWTLLTLIGGVEGRVATPLAGGLIGGLLGIALCLLPATPLGAMGWLGFPAGRVGLRLAALLGGLCGLVAGGLAGLLVGWIGARIGVFGAITGGISTAALGVLLQRRFHF
ncbi:MAG: serine/threonine protein kinase [Anaerolineales bacterium]|jgi:serine/threonine protein kinase|nr:serine/threonine protein kinase [Anaerolineales bacterium]